MVICIPQDRYNELLALQPVIAEIERLRGEDIKLLLEDIDELSGKDVALRDEKDQVCAFWLADRGQLNAADVMLFESYWDFSFGD